MKVSCHVIVAAKFNRGGQWINSTSVRMTKNKPSLDANEVAIKLNLELPDSLFRKPVLEGTIKVPEDSNTFDITPELQEGITKAIRDTTGVNVHLLVQSIEQPQQADEE